MLRLSHGAPHIQNVVRSSSRPSVTELAIQGQNRFLRVGETSLLHITSSSRTVGHYLKRHGSSRQLLSGDR
eukprot:7558362-Prorocentrum_lima.AAC.1